MANYWKEITLTISSDNNDSSSDFKYIEVSECESTNDILTLRFKHFGQYKANVFFTKETCCAIVFPFKTEFDLKPFIQKINF